jgi:hypothetical protein
LLEIGTGLGCAHHLFREHENGLLFLGLIHGGKFKLWRLALKCPEVTDWISSFEM